MLLTELHESQISACAELRPGAIRAPELVRLQLARSEAGRSRPSDRWHPDREVDRIAGQRSGTSIYAGQDARGSLAIGEIFREDCRQDDFFVPHPSQLKAELNGKDQCCPGREKLHHDADSRDLLGKVERMADYPVPACGDEPPRLGHYAEGLAQLRQ